MRLDRNTYGTVLLIYALSIVLIFVLVRFVPQWWIKWPLVAGLLWVCVWQTYFHMVPDRKPAGSDRIVTAVSDGKVVLVEKVHESQYLKRDALMISV